MAISLATLDSSNKKKPPVIAVYGSGGAGKTSLAAEFPKPIYIHTEGEETPDDVDIPSGEIATFAELLDLIGELLTEQHDFKTVIIDSMDAVEKMVWAYTCQRMGWDTIDSNDKGSPTAFGKGYLEADNDWAELIKAIKALSRSGIYVVLVMHSEIKSFNDPMVDSYDRYRPKLQKRAADLIIEKSDALLFLSKRTSVKQVEKGFGKKENKAEGMSGGERVIFTDERAGFLAKNRMNLPPSLSYKKGQGFADLSKHFSFANDNAPASEADAA
jgi:hypothetical protein